MLLAVLPESCPFIYKNMLGVEVCACLSDYAASGGKLLPTFRYRPSFPSSMSKVPIEDGTDRLSRNFGNNLEEHRFHPFRSGSLKSRMMGGFLIAWPISDCPSLRPTFCRCYVVRCLSGGLTVDGGN